MQIRNSKQFIRILTKRTEMSKNISKNIFSNISIIKGHSVELVLNIRIINRTVEYNSVCLKLKW